MKTEAGKKGKINNQKERINCVALCSQVPGQLSQFKMYKKPTKNILGITPRINFSFMQVHYMKINTIDVGTADGIISAAWKNEKPLNVSSQDEMIIWEMVNNIYCTSQ